jgi:DegV family protein with EDD domain
MKTLQQGFAAGYACLSARADLLDRINVFPVADSDTGANLRISLGPLRCCGPDRAIVAAQLVRCATGNSGNIAAAFFSELLTAESLEDLPAQAARGRARAWQAVAAPLGGTMLSVFDSLAEVLARSRPTATSCEAILAALRKTVLATAQTLPDLQAAGVVDSGALGMFVFFDGFFRTVTGHREKSRPLVDLFPGHLAVAADYNPECPDAYCVDAIIQPAAGSTCTTASVAALGESVVVIPDQSRMKIHIHTADPDDLRSKLAGLGEVVGWSDEPLHRSAKSHAPRFEPFEPSGCLHIMTDAAGSLPRALARQHDITLLDSYIVSGDTARPESLCTPETIYALMREGHKVTTAQASLMERHHLYGSVCEQFGRTLYLCVGSAFTGNHDAAVAWKQEHDSGQLLEIIDTGAASGRLALIALLVNRLARRTEDADAVLAYARRLADTSREYIFIDTLRHLVAGGRISRTSGFFGDLLHRKPVISQTKEGVRPMGTVRNRQAQLDFALDKVRAEIDAAGKAVLLLQYSDNRTWVAEVAKPQVQALLPRAEMILTPLSLTSGVHMGPGTWSLAFAAVD